MIRRFVNAFVHAQAYATHAHIDTDRRKRTLIPWLHCKPARSSIPTVVCQIHQALEGFDEHNSKLAWLEPYCWTVGCNDAMGQKTASLRRMKNTRLRGNMTASCGAH